MSVCSFTRTIIINISTPITILMIDDQTKTVKSEVEN